VLEALKLTSLAFVIRSYGAEHIGDGLGLGLADGVGVGLGLGLALGADVGAGVAPWPGDAVGA
jgi:hypothetical protein